MLQAQIHHALNAANNELGAYNAHSADEHARLVGKFATHAATLQSVHGTLLRVFRRTRALRARLLAAHPELADKAAAADAAREAEIERERASTAASSSGAAEAPVPQQQLAGLSVGGEVDASTRVQHA